jgi:hypothetical protein
MPPSNPYYFFLGELPTPLESSNNDIKQMLGPAAGLVTVPYFALPPWRELFADTEGRFPQLQYLPGFLKESDEKDGEFWFARVMPEDGGRDQRVMGLTVRLTEEGEVRLAKQVATKSFRYVGTSAAEGDGA